MPSIDLHAHILPAVDDGPADLEGAVALARAAVAAGTAVLVATPHVNDHHFIEPDAIPAAVAALSEHLGTLGIPLRLHAGAELSLTRAHDLSASHLQSLALGEGSCLLLECPFATDADTFEPSIRAVLWSGQRVLLAHPERCTAFQREPGRLRRLVDDGALVQITAGSATGGFGSHVRQFTLRLLREGLVHVVASDAHDTRLRPPGVFAALAAVEPAVPGLGARVPWLTESVPAALLADEPIPEPAPLPADPRPGWRRLLARAT